MFASVGGRDMKPKPATTTFRLDGQTLTFLRKQAEEQKTSLNTLVNQIFSKYAEWDAFGEKYGFVNFPHDFYRGIIDSADEGQLRRNASVAGRQLRDYLLFSFKRADTSTFVCSLKLAGRYSGMGSFEIEQERSTCKVIVHHSLGRKHSLYVCTALEEAIISIVGVHPKCEVTDVSVIIEFAIAPPPEPHRDAGSRGKLVQNVA